MVKDWNFSRHEGSGSNDGARWSATTGVDCGGRRRRPDHGGACAGRPSTTGILVMEVGWPRDQINHDDGAHPDNLLLIGKPVGLIENSSSPRTSGSR